MIGLSMDSDVFFITYDEPNAEDLWRRLQKLVPRAKRVHGVKGFDAAYKTCAAQSSTERFFTVDGDNELDKQFAKLSLSPELAASASVLSWSASNSLNGLCYGNGGVKSWPRHLVASMRTHEVAEVGNASVDFCYQLNYYQMADTLSRVHVNGSPYQAFRAGFREGVKMCLERGVRPELGKPLSDHVSQSNLRRLRIWCSVGADMPNGEWAIFGARLGCKMLCLSDWNFENIRDYEWFQAFWENEIRGQDPSLRLEAVGQELNERIGLGVTTLSPESSRFFKSVFINSTRQGPMFP